MSSPFITIARGDDLQSTKFRAGMTVAEMQAVTSKTIPDEIYLAYVERTFSASGSTPGGSPLQETLSDIQTWIEGACVGFVDHVSGPLNAGSTGFLYFTLATWRSAAGLNASGFRRSTDKGITFSYGLMQRGDHLGWWVYEDLQKGFSSLRWGLLSGSGGTSALKTATANSTAFQWRPEWCAPTLATYNAAWAGASWSGDYNPFDNGGIWYIAAGLKSLGISGYGGFLFRGRRNRGTVSITGLSSVSGHAADLYVVPSKYAILPGGTQSFGDLDGLGFVDGNLFLLESFGLSSDTSHTSSIVGNSDADPVALAGLGCPVTIFTLTQKGVKLTGSYWLLKWDFTNQNA